MCQGFGLGLEYDIYFYACFCRFFFVVFAGMREYGGSLLVVLGLGCFDILYILLRGFCV